MSDEKPPLYLLLCIFLVVLFLCDMPRNRIKTRKKILLNLKENFIILSGTFFHRNRNGGTWPTSIELWQYRRQCWPTLAMENQLRECCCWTSMEQQTSDVLWQHRGQCWPTGNQLRECCCWTSMELRVRPNMNEDSPPRLDLEQGK